jgi:hypothetical protein
MTMSIEVDRLPIADFFNVPWHQVRHMDLGSYTEKDIENNNKWTDEKIKTVFEKCCPQGLASHLKSLLDQGYSIFIHGSSKDLDYESC